MRTLDSGVFRGEALASARGDVARIWKSGRHCGASRRRIVIPLTAQSPLSLSFVLTRLLISLLSPLNTGGCTTAGRSKTTASRTEERQFGDAILVVAYMYPFFSVLSYARQGHP
jgi:hypothetical protein